MYSDAHIHMSKEMLQLLKKEPFLAIASCTNDMECKETAELCQQYPLLKMSCGIHPWHASTISMETMRKWMDTSDIIGEIGMDNVWCDVALDLQEDVFVKQVIYAYEHHKPVILHTKGQEERIAKIIKKYPNTYLVHWYSCMEHLALYKEMDCYFSVGPDLQDPSVQQVVQEVDLSRLLIESDGVHAIAWAKNCDVEEVKYFKTLEDTAIYIAKQKQIDKNVIWQTINENLFCFLENR